MKLSFVMCSNRKGLATIARVANLAALASDDVEIVVHDNSGDPEKQDFLAKMQGPNRKIVSVNPCSSWENMVQAVALATGDYIFEVGDDDDVSSFSIPPFLKAIDEIDADPSYVMVNGFYIIEAGGQSALYAYENLDSPSPAGRVASFLSSPYCVLTFSAIRRSLRSNIDAFSRSMPFRFAYLDQIQSALWLCSGRVRRMDRLTYAYDLQNWASPDRGRKADLRFFTDAGVDASALRLKELINAFEGAKAITQKYAELPLTTDQRLDVGRAWFGHKFERFCRTSIPDNPAALFDRESVALADKWRAASEFDFRALLTDLSDFFALSDPAAGQQYYDFWK